MAFSDNHRINWGCILAPLVFAPIAFVIFIGTTLGGGGCEGRPAPCSGNFNNMWLQLGGLLVASIIFGWSVNRIAKRLRHRD
ncbi:hypothetical protein OLX23_03335 [Novosphingobium sp. JCM 18896]|nr:hypothetical protein [Novosphingobium sp. JCM 18896]